MKKWNKVRTDTEQEVVFLRSAARQRPWIQKPFLLETAHTLLLEGRDGHWPGLSDEDTLVLCLKRFVCGKEDLPSWGLHLSVNVLQPPSVYPVLLK